MPKFVVDIPSKIAQKFVHAKELNYNDIIDAYEGVDKDIHINFGKNGIPAQEILDYLKLLDDQETEESAG